MWNHIESEGKSIIIINNLEPNSKYHVCIKCRQIYSDPQGEEICDNVQTMSTLGKIYLIN